MCIFTLPSVDVADTRLYARRAGPGRQILVYEMSYAAPEPLAMVLPLPVASRDEETALRFIDLSHAAEFFDDLAKLVWLVEVRRRSSMDLLSSSADPVRPPLRVHEVGAFEASFVPSVADFDRLDARFRLPGGVFEAMPQYADFGFAVFKLRETTGGLKGAHPMAFEFSTRLTDALFLPTVHVHDGSVHRLARFDHLAYVQGDCYLSREPRYFDQGRELDQRACASRRNELWRDRPDGWKFPPTENVLGVIWPAGPSEALRTVRTDPGTRAIVEDVRADRVSASRKHSWMRMPLLDLDQDLFAVGMSGMLPNADSIIRLEPASSR